MFLRPDCTEPARQESQCLPFLWARLFQFPTPILIWGYISQRQYINRQITMPLPESNLSAEFCLKNKKKPLADSLCLQMHWARCCFSRERLRLWNSFISLDAFLPRDDYGCRCPVSPHPYVNVKAVNCWESIQESMNTFSFQYWQKATLFYTSHN